MLPVLQIGPFAFQAPSLLLLLGLWLGMSFGARYSHRFDVDGKKVDDVALLAILFTIIGGRIFYVIRYPTAFLENPTSLLSLNPVLFDFSGGLLVGALSLLIIVQRKQLDLWCVLDALTIPSAIFMIFLGFSHLASGKVYGITTKLPWAIHLFGETRHPTQVYEIIMSGGILYYLLRRLPRNETQLRTTKGVFFLEFISLTSIAWILIDTFRADTHLFMFNIRTLQVVALIVLICSFWLINKRLAKASGQQKGKEV